MAIVRARALVSGRVQGVFYRATTVKKANQLGDITGWAKNLRDGRVEVLCEGPKEKVDALIAWLKVGPTLGKVDDVAVTWEETAGGLDEFTVAW
jgi:acylphosphatase